MFGQRLKELRKEKRMRIEDFAEEIDLKRSTYAGYETEKRTPPIENLIKLAEIHDTSTDYILGLTDNRQSNKNEKEMSFLLDKDNIKWRGVPLSEEELQPIKDVLNLYVKNKLNS